MSFSLEPLPSTDSFLGRLDPRWKLAALALAAAAAAALHTLPPVRAALAGAAALGAAALLPWRWYRARAGTVLLFLGLFALPLPFLLKGDAPVWQVGPLTVSAHGALAGLRLV